MMYAQIKASQHRQLKKRSQVGDTANKRHGKGQGGSALQCSRGPQLPDKFLTELTPSGTAKSGVSKGLSPALLQQDQVD